MVNHDKAQGAHLTTRARGLAAEERAAQWLSAQGMVIIERNFCVRGGEIDLIGRWHDTLVFVEVRQRRSASYGGAAASITRSKQQRIILAAQHYLARLPGRPPPCRFDCVLFEGDKPPLWLQNAFEC